MEKKHRDAIQKNFSSLVERTDLDLMVAALFEKGVFSDAMIEPYKDTTKDSRTRRRQLYLDIMRRGPDAFRHLLDTLSENGYWDIVRELDPNSSLHPIPRPPPSSTLKPEDNSYVSIATMREKNTGKEQEDPNRNKGSGERQSVSSEGGNSKSEEEQNGNSDNTGLVGAGDAPGGKKFHVVKSTRFFEDNGNDIKLYRTRGRNRGVLLLFTYVTFEFSESSRDGAMVDANNLKDLFGDIGFKVRTFTDCSLKETLDVLENLHTAEGLCEGPETVFIVFSSHGYGRSGTGDTDIRCKDGHLISYYEIIAYFNNEKFPALKGIPKVFIFQTCRGPKDNRGITPSHLPAPSFRYDSARAAAPSAPAAASAPSGRRPREAGGGGTAHDGRTYRDEDSGSDSDTARDRIYSDILIANSTVPGYVSSRDKALGSWYIQVLCKVFAARAHDCHVEKLFTLVDEALRKHFPTQTSSVDRWGFNRRLYLHPGLYEQ